jgi:DNA-directed RNA polymerase specialized sigma24 family protein
MTLPTDEILRFLPELRRYASALTGSTRSGDEYIRVALETLVEEPWRLQPGSEVKLELNGLFHRALQICRFQEWAGPTTSDASAEMQRRVMALSLLNRKLLILVDLEALPVSSAAELLRLSEDEAEWRLAAARHALEAPQPAFAHADGRRRARRWMSAARGIGVPTEMANASDRAV